MAWPRVFEGISLPGRCPIHGRRVSADGTGLSAREALCARTTTRGARAPLERLGAGPRPTHRGRRPAGTTRPARPGIPLSLPDLIRGGTSFRGDQQQAPARPAHLCSRHQRPAGRPERPDQVRRARSGAPDRRGHGTGGQAAPSGARILRPAGPAPARRLPCPSRTPGRPDLHRRSGRDPARRAQPLGSGRSPGGLPPGGQRLPHPRRRPQPPGRGIRRHRRLQGPAAAHQSVIGRPARRGVPRRARHHGLRLDRDVRAAALR